jgi:hypothetical protein
MVRDGERAGIWRCGGEKESRGGMVFVNLADFSRMAEGFRWFKVAEGDFWRGKLQKDTFHSAASVASSSL